MKALKSWLVAVCASFTLVVLGVIIIESFIRGEISRDYGNILLCLLWTAIAVGILSIYPLFEKLPTLWIIILQYLIALSLILGSVKLFNLSEPFVRLEKYTDAFRSFTLFYVVGAGYFYIEQIRSAKRNNKMIEEIRKSKKSKI